MGKLSSVSDSGPSMEAAESRGEGLRNVEESSFAIVSNGFGDGAPQALRDYLLARKVERLTTVFHPLVPEEEPVHRVQHWARGELVRSRTVRLPWRPPLTYPLDLVVPPWLPPVDCWL